MLLTEVIERIGDRVPALAGRIRGAAEYQSSLRTRATLQGAYVMPAGLRGGRVLDVTGGYIQHIDEIVAVVIVVPDPNAVAARQLATIDELIRATIDAVCGWRPAEAIGPFQLLRAAMINLGNGALAYQIDLSLPSQLRIAP